MEFINSIFGFDIADESLRAKEFNILADKFKENKVASKTEVKEETKEGEFKFGDTNYELNKIRIATNSSKYSTCCNECNKSDRDNLFHYFLIGKEREAICLYVERRCRNQK